MAPIPVNEKSGNRKCHQINQLFISLLKCSAIHGIGEKLSLNPKTFLSSLMESIGNSPVYSRFGLLISPSYNSGSRNSPLGFELNFFLSAITRKTNKAFQQFQDSEDYPIDLGTIDVVMISLGGSKARRRLSRDCSS